MKNIKIYLNKYSKLWDKIRKLIRKECNVEVIHKSKCINIK